MALDSRAAVLKFSRYHSHGHSHPRVTEKDLETMQHLAEVCEEDFPEGKKIDL